MTSTTKPITPAQTIENNEMLTELGTTIRSIRKDRGAVLKDVEEWSGISTGTQSRIENGIGDYGIMNLIAIAKALNLKLTITLEEAPVQPKRYSVTA